MILNFELPTDAFQAPAKTFKGGSWKDRLTARKSAQWGRMKAEERATGKTPDYGNARGQKEEYIRPDGQPSKRPRTDSNNADPGFKPRTGPRPGGRAPSERETLPKSTTGEVISGYRSRRRNASRAVERTFDRRVGYIHKSWSLYTTRWPPHE
jgi:ATP-dependent RNA helicase DDX31/DBP7